ncbi:hypothetical protein HOY82DRAFT_672802 [Tuber indicum]|nr:hypothetical protein HOY82DRAFT_672802 [Tuber indicum]
MAPKTNELQTRCRDAGLDPTGKHSELVQRLNDKLKELKKQCKEVGLDHTGEVPELLQRLKEHRRRSQSSSTDLEDTGDAVLLTESTTGTEEDTMGDARHALEQALNVEELEVPGVAGKVYVRNPGGPVLAGLPERFRILEEDITRTKDKIAAHEARLAELSDDISLLRLASPDYKRVRHSFLTVFKQDKLKEQLTRKDHEIMEEGNVTVDFPDAVIDALLYDGPDRRNDTFVFEALYGLHPSDVKDISHKETIDLLNRHARVISRNDKTGTREFYENFKVFVKEFKRLDDGVDYLDEGPTNAACAAYWSVYNCQTYEDRNGQSWVVLFM